MMSAACSMVHDNRPRRPCPVPACYPCFAFLRFYFSLPLHYINTTGIPCNPHHNSTVVTVNYYTACFRIVSYRFSRPDPTLECTRLGACITLLRSPLPLPFQWTRHTYPSSRRPDNVYNYTDAPELPYCTSDILRFPLGIFGLGLYHNPARYCPRRQCYRRNLTVPYYLRMI